MITLIWAEDLRGRWNYYAPASRLNGVNPRPDMISVSVDAAMGTVLYNMDAGVQSVGGSNLQAARTLVLPAIDFYALVNSMVAQQSQVTRDYSMADVPRPTVDAMDLSTVSPLRQAETVLMTASPIAPFPLTTRPLLSEATTSGLKHANTQAQNHASVALGVRPRPTPIATGVVSTATGQAIKPFPINTLLLIGLVVTAIVLFRKG